MIARAAHGNSVVTHEFVPLEIDAAKALLGCLVKDYQMACAIPLPFWLGPAQVYHATLTKGTNQKTALYRAKAVLERLRSEGELDWHFECLYGTDPCAEQWPALAGVPQVPSFSQWTERWLGSIYGASITTTENDLAQEVEISA